MCRLMMKRMAQRSKSLWGNRNRELRTLRLNPESFSFYNSNMRNVLITLATVILVSGLALVLTTLPIKQEVAEIPFVLEDGMRGVVEISEPRFLRFGDPANLEMKVTLLPGENNKESVKIKASLQSVTLAKEPDSAVTAVIPADGIARFEWKIWATTRDEQRMTVWCFRQGAEGITLILARDITFEVRSILEMRYRLVRWILIELMILSLLLAGLTLFRIRRN